jgi:acetyl esterase/lipase
MQTLAYGLFASQDGDLHLPNVPRPAVVCLLHGGFWRMPYGRDQMTPVARDLAGRGLAVWNLEYRRLGAPGGGWPGTFEDVAAGIDHLATLAARGVDLDLARVTVVGHSAGGQLALWSAARARWSGGAVAQPRVRVSAAAGLAPLADLESVHDLGLGGAVVAELLGGSPRERPERYRAASPAALLPLGVPQLILHGLADDVVPIEIARNYARAARAAGDRIEAVELPRTGHMEFLDPQSDAHAALCRWLGAGTVPPPIG